MTTPSARSPTVALAFDDEALAGFRRVLRNLAAMLDAHLEGAVADTDPELLHELRVAVRRTRSVLSQGTGVVPPGVRDEYRKHFGWLGQVTGPARDLDVHVIGWDAYVAPLSDVDRRALGRVLSEVEARRRTAHAQLADVLRSAATHDVLDGWRSWLDDPEVGPVDAQPLGPFVAHRIAKAQKKVLRDGRLIDPASPAERLHDLRKDTKKLRYLLECFGGLFKAKPLKTFVSQLKALQDNLGEHQDAEIHLGQLRELAHDLHERATLDTDALLAMGSLSDHLDRTTSTRTRRVCPTVRRLRHDSQPQDPGRTAALGGRRMTVRRSLAYVAPPCRSPSPKTTAPSPRPPSDFLQQARRPRRRPRRCSRRPTEELPAVLEGRWPASAGSGLHIPEEHGGSGYGLEELVVVVEELGRAVAPGPVRAHRHRQRRPRRRRRRRHQGSVLPGLADGSVVRGRRPRRRR